MNLVYADGFDPTQFAVQAHDAALVALDAIAKAGSLDPERVRAVDLPLLAGDAGRLRALGWEPRRGLDEALADLWTEASGAAAAPGDAERVPA